MTTLPIALLAAALSSGRAAAPMPPDGAAPWALPSAPGAEPDATDLVKIELLADVERAAPGETFHLAVAMAIAPHWHTYWRNPGASGAAPQIDLKLPDGWTAGEIRFPRPRTFDGPEGMTIGYEHEAVLFVPVVPAKDAPAGPVEIEASIFYLVCREACLIGDVAVGTSVEVASAGTAAVANRDPRLERARQRMPKRLPIATADRATVPGVRLDEERGLVVIELRAEGRGRPRFLGAPSAGVEFGPATTTDFTRMHQDRVVVEVPFRIDPVNAGEDRITLRGIVLFGDRPDDPAWEFVVVPGAASGSH